MKEKHTHIDNLIIILQKKTNRNEKFQKRVDLNCIFAFLIFVHTFK